jgi:hypothetical protein
MSAALRVGATSSSRPTRRMLPASPGTARFRDGGQGPGEAIAEVRPLVEGRRLRTFLATGTYKDELADARWVA